MLKRSVISFLLLTLLFSATALKGYGLGKQAVNQPVEHQQTLQKDFNLEEKGILVLPIEIGNSSSTSRLISLKKALTGTSYLLLQELACQYTYTTRNSLALRPTTVPRYLYHRNIRL